jgi:hypothetical protein
MSNERAIAAVTATLKSVVFRAVAADADLAGTEVTARPPDRARQGAAGGNQLNLFMYRTSIDPALRNQEPPGLRGGETGQPALPLILSYLLTAYGENDDEVLSHRLLGVGMQVLHDRPLLAPNDIAAALPGSGLDQQVERVRITPHPVPLDEISRMWATFQTGYRTSVTYDAAVVLMDSRRPTVSPTPVIARSDGDIGPIIVGNLPPTVAIASVPGGRPAARPGDRLILVGDRLGEVRGVQVTGLRLPEPVTLPCRAEDSHTIIVELPTDPAIPAGTVALAPLSPAEPGVAVQPGPAIPVALAPTLTNRRALSAGLTDGAAMVTVRCAPPVVAGQSLALVVGDRIVVGTPAAPGSAARSQIAFALTGFTPGSYLLRLRVDGQDSVPIADDPHALDATQRVVLR